MHEIDHSMLVFARAATMKTYRYILSVIEREINGVDKVKNKDDVSSSLRITSSLNCRDDPSNFFPRSGKYS